MIFDIYSKSPIFAHETVKLGKASWDPYNQEGTTNVARPF